MRICIIEGSTSLFSEHPATLIDLPAPQRWGVVSAQPRLLQWPDHEILVLARHGSEHELAPHQINYRANVAALHAWQADLVVGTYTVGGVDPDLAVGELAAPDQIIDYTWGRDSTFDDHLRHIEFSLPFDEQWRQRLVAAGPEAGIAVVDGGVYAATQGPRLETIAEVRRLAADGATLVGMTGMPEAALFREMDIPFINLSLVVNPAAGVGDQDQVGGEIDMQALQQASAAGAKSIEALLTAFFQQL